MELCRFIKTLATYLNNCLYWKYFKSICPQMPKPFWGLSSCAHAFPSAWSICRLYPKNPFLLFRVTSSGKPLCPHPLFLWGWLLLCCHLVLNFTIAFNTVYWHFLMCTFFFFSCSVFKGAFYTVNFSRVGSDCIHFICHVPSPVPGWSQSMFVKPTWM